MVNKISVKEAQTPKRASKTKIRTVTIVNSHYIGDIKMSEAFEQALAINAQKPYAKAKTAG